MPPPPDMAQWLATKYGILGQQAEGQYQLNLAQAYKAREEGAQVAETAAAQRGLVGAQAYKTREEGGEVAPNAASQRELQAAQSYKASEEAKQVAPSAASLRQWQGAESQRALEEAASTRADRTDYAAGLQLGANLGLPSVPEHALDQPVTPAVQPVQSIDRTLDVNTPVQPKTVAPLPLASLRRSSNPDVSSQVSSPVMPYSRIRNLLGQNTDQQGLKKGTANVKSKSKGSKGGGGSKAAKGGGGTPPAGLEEILPALMAASQGGGAAGPQAADGSPPTMAPGAAAPPGFAEGTSNVVRSAIGALADFYHKGLSANPTVQHALNQVPGSQTMQRVLQSQAANDAFSAANTAIMPKGFARGAPNVQPNPGFPFGAGYLFGATAVPGQGSGTVDKVPAMLAPHEAVLNRAAADMLGRGKIAALNAAGTKQMGMRRGMPVS